MHDELLPGPSSVRLRPYPLLILLIGLGALACLMLTLFFIRASELPRTSETMRMADVARQLADGKGFSTKIATPLEIGLVKKINPKPDLFDPPLFPVFIAVLFEPLLEGDIAGRMASVLAFILMLAVVGYWGAKAFDLRTGAIAVVITCLTPGLLLNAVSGRPEPLAALFLAAAALPLIQRVRGLEAPPVAREPFKAIWPGLFISLAGLTVYPALVLVIPIAVLVRAVYTESRRRALLWFGMAWLAPQAIWLLRLSIVTGRPLLNPWIFMGGMFTRSRPGLAMTHIYTESARAVLKDSASRGGELFLKFWSGFVNALSFYPVIFGVVLFGLLLLGLWLKAERPQARALRLSIILMGVLLPVMIGIFVPDTSYLALLGPLGLLYAVVVLLFLMDLLNSTAVKEGQYVFVPARKQPGELFAHHVFAILGFCIYSLVTCLPFLSHPMKATGLPPALVEWVRALPPDAILLSDKPEELGWATNRLSIGLPPSGAQLAALVDATQGITAVILSPDSAALDPHSIMGVWQGVYTGLTAPADLVPIKDIDRYIILAPGEGARQVTQ